MSRSPQQRPISVRHALLVVVLVLAAVLAVVMWPDAPRENPPGRNRVPVVAAKRQPRYVDDRQCADCHTEIYATYAQHPMGRSMGPAKQMTAGAPLPEDGVAFAAGQYRYEIRQDDELIHVETRLDENGEPIATASAPIAYAIGSAERGRSYLVNRNGRLFMSPITWYPQKHRWDLSPGYEKVNSHFNRPVVVQCLFCHANRTHPVHGTLGEYEEPIFSGHAIGCQRCHGPGEEHIALHEGTLADEDQAETIVNPAKLEPDLREAVCQQCHLSGAAKVVRRGKELQDFRPGMPLDEVIRIFVHAHPDGETAKFVGHAEQMYASRCFQASDGQMGCISCHDPHKKPAAAARLAHFRSRCLACHEEQGCSETIEARQAAGDDNCLACHMPARSTEIRHAAITDHRILRRPGAAPAGTDGQADPPGGDIRPFHTPRRDDAELRRDRALALLRVDDTETAELNQALLKELTRDLEEAVRRHPDDLPAWEGFGIAAWRLGNPAFALRCFESVLGQAPRREFAVSNAATLSSGLKRQEQALAYWQQAVEINPWIVRYRAELAAALGTAGRWRECETLCRETLEHFPDSNRSRQHLVESLLAQGRHEAAESELAAWLRFRPADPEKLKAWFLGHPLRGSR